MTSSKRLRGLQLLASFGLPTPQLQVVDSSADVEHLHLYDNTEGWTIRTCRKDGAREFGLFYLNNTPRNQVQFVLRRRLLEHSKLEFYIVYPSWAFNFSFNVVYDDGIYHVEGSVGSQKAIAMGLSNPEFTFTLTREPSLRLIKGDSEQSPFFSKVKMSVWTLRRLPLFDFYTEVAITADRKMIFYELFPLREAF